MKKLNKLAYVAALFFSAFLLNSCDQVKVIKVEKTIDGGTVEFLLAPQTNLNYDVAKSDMMDIAELIKPYDLTMDNLKSLKIESAVVDIIDSTATPVNFDIADNMSVEIGTSTLASNKIAYKDPVPHTGLIALPLDVMPDVDLIPYAKSNDINYHLKLKLNKALDHPVQMKLTLKWKIVGEI
jgi:hypothetical protein